MTEMDSQFSTRLVTRNLLVSATNYRRGRMTESNLTDLCRLINLAVLNEKLITVGNRRETDRKHKPRIPPVYDAVRKLTGIEVKVEIPDVTDVINAVELLDEGKRSVLEQALGREVLDRPDYLEHFYAGKISAKAQSAVGAGSKAEEALNFYYRSFIYVGYSRYSKTPFTPDNVRNTGLRMLEEGTPDYQEKLLKTIQDIHGDEVFHKTKGTNIEIPPFAAVVFKRARSQEDIPERVAELRDEMKPVREALEAFSQEKEWGGYYEGLTTLFPPRSSERERTKIADEKVQKALENLRKESKGLRGLSARMGVRPLLEIALTAHSIFKAYMLLDPEEVAKVSLELALKVSPAVEHQWRKSAFAEVQSIGREVSGPFDKSAIDLTKLFGSIDPDPVVRKPTKL